jgi:NAD(P)-dependent dehydrogenase (short-subunit alcohol dehydrogenase family)
MNSVHESDRKVVLLTGASGRIGTALCEKLAPKYDVVGVRNNWPLKVNSQYQAYIDPFVHEDQSANGIREVFEVAADLRHESEVARVIEVALARFGRIDVLVNAVGGFQRGAELLGDALSRAAELFVINAVVPTSVATQVALEYWRHHDRENAAQNRVVINLSAAAAIDPSDTNFAALFGATKAAQNMLSLRLGKEFEAFNVRVMTLAPASVPEPVSLERVTSAVEALIEGDKTGQIMLLWADNDELV